MFCTKCGANLADNQAFCTKCGNPTGVAPAPVAAQPVAPVVDEPVVAPVAEEPVAPVVEAQPEQEAPVVQPETFVPPMAAPAYAPYTPPQPKVGKQKFLTKVAPGNVRTCAWLAWVAAIAAIAVLVGGWFAFLNTSIEDIPVISMAAGDSLDELDDAKDEIKDALKEVEDRIDELEDELSEEEFEALEAFLAACEDLSDDLSFGNVMNVVDTVAEIADLEVDGEELSEVDNMKETLEQFDELSEVLELIQFIPLVILLAFAMFTLLGGLLRIRGLAITGMILTTLFALPFMSTLFVVGNIVLHIALIVVTSITTSAWKNYRKAY